MSNTHLHNDVLYPHRTYYFRLVNGRCVPGPIWKKREYRLKFLLRTLLFWSSTRRMLGSTLAGMTSISYWPANPRYPVKPTAST